MAAQQKIGKKLPRRCTNTNLQSRRQRSWIKGQERKKMRREAQAKREKANRELRALGLPTPHEAKKLAVKAARLLNA